MRTASNSYTNDGHFNDIDDKIREYADKFLKEIYYRDKANKIILYNKYRETRKYNDSIDKYLGGIYYDKAADEMKHKKYIPENVKNENNDIENESSSNKNKDAGLLALLDRPCETKADLDNLMKDIYRYKAENIVKLDGEEYFKNNNINIATMRSGYEKDTLYTDFGEIEFSKPKYRKPFKSKFLDSFPKIIFAQEIKLLKENKFSISKIEEIVKIFAEQRNTKAPSGRTIERHTQQK